MKALIYCFVTTTIFTLMGCPGETSEEPRPVTKLPMCFYSVSDNVIIKSIKVFTENGGERYFACGVGHKITSEGELGPDCNLQGNEVFLEAQDSSATGLTGPAKEISEHCLDNPISGRCEKWNCGELLSLAPYPDSCYRIDDRATGSCSSMWNKEEP